MKHLLDTDTCIYWLTENLILVTNNTRHYDRIPKIKLDN